MRPASEWSQVTTVSFNLAYIVAHLTRAEPGSDDALTLVLAGRTISAESPRRDVTKFRRHEAEVLQKWAAQIAAATTKSSNVNRHQRDDELTAEAQLWVLEQLADFRATDDGGTAGAFLRARQPWFRSAARRRASPGLKSKSRFTVSGAAGQAREDLLHLLGREPTQSELKAATTAKLNAQIRAEVAAKEPHLSGKEISDTVERRMKKDGLERALNDFADVQISGQAPVSFNTFDDPDVIVGAAYHLKDVSDSAPDPEDELDQLMRVALGDHQWARSALSLKGGSHPARVETEPDSATYRALSAEAGRTQSEIKKVLGRARARIAAPHAQWAHCAPGIAVA